MLVIHSFNYSCMCVYHGCVFNVVRLSSVCHQCWCVFCCVSLQGQGAITEKLRSFSMHDLTQISQGDVYPGYSSSNPARRAIMDQPDGAGTSLTLSLQNFKSILDLFSSYIDRCKLSVALFLSWQNHTEGIMGYHRQYDENNVSRRCVMFTSVHLCTQPRFWGFGHSCVTRQGNKRFWRTWGCFSVV